MQRTVYQCDVCKTEQQQANHWFSVLSYRGSNRLMISPLLKDSRGEDGSEVFHLCGEACVIRKVNEYLGAFNKGPAKVES